MKYGSVCSGVEAASVAWHHLSWEPQWFSEIDKFPSAVLNHHFPSVPNLGDMTNYKEWPDEPISLLVGGTPCQSFSVAGLRKGLDDPRGNLMLTYLGIADRYKPKWLVWENVPGVLSSNKGRDFGTFLGALGALGYGFAYRVLDAQYFGVAQRRRRVFVVGYLGDWRRAAAVLFERESLSGNPAPSREAKQDVAGTVTTRSGSGGGGGLGTDEACGGFLQPVTNRMRGFGDYIDDETASALKARDYKDATDLIAFSAEMSGTQAASTPEVSPTLSVGHTTAVADRLCVRRLTPIECERLQGFPDNYTRIPWRNKAPDDCPDGPRYKAMGNSMAGPVMRWIGEIIQMVEEITDD